MARRKPKSKQTRKRETATQKGLGSLAAATILAAAVVFVYWSSLGGQFVLDDDASILENPHIRGDRSLLSTLAPPDQAPDAPRWRGPVIAFTLAVNHRLGGLDPVGYHVLNVALHLLAALVLFGVVRRTLSLKEIATELRSAATNLALSAALLWALHPLLTDAVTYVIQRTTVMTGLFLLSCLYCVLRGAASEKPNRWYVAAVVCCCAGMLSKESMVVAPVLVLIFDRVFVADSWTRVWRERARMHLALGATWAALAWLIVVSPHPGNIGLSLRVGPLDYLLTQTHVILQYLRLAVWPAGLVLDYGAAVPVTFAARLRSSRSRHLCRCGDSRPRAAGTRRRHRGRFQT
jgi:hypothetical protein